MTVMMGWNQILVHHGFDVQFCPRILFKEVETMKNRIYSVA